MVIPINKWNLFLEEIKNGKSKFTASKYIGSTTEKINEEIEKNMDKKLEYIHALENSIDYINDLIFEGRNEKFFNVLPCKIRIKSIEKELDEMILSYDIACNRYNLIEPYIHRLRYYTLTGKMDSEKSSKIMTMLKDYSTIISIEDLKNKIEELEKMEQLNQKQ